MAGLGLGLEQRTKLSCGQGTDEGQAAWQTKVAGTKKAELPCGQSRLGTRL
jgi:hypothetical protein